MKEGIHPKYTEISVTCNCGNKFVTRSALGKEAITLEVCAKCHPFYTGTQKLVDTAGRVDRFRQKYAKRAAPEAAPVLPNPPVKKLAASKKPVAAKKPKEKPSKT